MKRKVKNVRVPGRGSSGVSSAVRSARKRVARATSRAQRAVAQELRAIAERRQCRDIVALEVFKQMVGCHGLLLQPSKRSPQVVMAYVMAEEFLSVGEAIAGCERAGYEPERWAEALLRDTTPKEPDERVSGKPSPTAN